jgi:hypothetical protein
MRGCDYWAVFMDCVMEGRWSAARAVALESGRMLLEQMSVPTLTMVIYEGDQGCVCRHVQIANQHWESEKNANCAVHGEFAMSRVPLGVCEKPRHVAMDDAQPDRWECLITRPGLARHWALYDENGWGRYRGQIARPYYVYVGDNVRMDLSMDVRRGGQSVSFHGVRADRIIIDDPYARESLDEGQIRRLWDEYLPQDLTNGSRRWREQMQTPTPIEDVRHALEQMRRLAEQTPMTAEQAEQIVRSLTDDEGR